MSAERGDVVGAEAAGRLVEQQQARARHESAGERDALAVGVGERGDRERRRTAREARAASSRCVDAAPRHPVCPRDRHEDVLAHREPVEEPQALERA